MCPTQGRLNPLQWGGGIPRSSDQDTSTRPPWQIRRGWLVSVYDCRDVKNHKDLEVYQALLVDHLVHSLLADVSCSNITVISSKSENHSSTFTSRSHNKNHSCSNITVISSKSENHSSTFTSRSHNKNHSLFFAPGQFSTGTWSKSSIEPRPIRSLELSLP